MDLNIGDCGWKLINQGSDKCLKIRINEDICIMGEIFKYFDEVLKFLTKDQALLYRKIL